MRLPRLLAGTDTAFLIALGLLVATGSIFLASASAPLAFERLGSSGAYVRHQLLVGVLPGIAVGFLVLRMRRFVLERLALPMYGASVLLLILVLVPGVGIVVNGTRSWIGVAGFSFQPAELAKLGLIFGLAAWATMRRPAWFALDTVRSGLLPFLGALGLIVGLTLLQPDVGTAVILVAIGIGMFFAAGGRILHLVMLGAVGVILLGLLVLAAPYRVNRLAVFLRPETDPQGVGYQVSQALLAVGSGGITGVGLGHSRQKFSFLPEVIADSIFAIVAEEIGFIFSMFFLALIAYVLWRVFASALHATDAFSRLVLVGIGTWWGVQSLVNIGAMVGLLPLTGLPLPFVSYGGTAMVAGLAAAGIVANMSRNRSA